MPERNRAASFLQLDSVVNPPVDLTVVLAEAIDNPDLGEALAALARACVGIRTEVIVVRPAGRPALPSVASLALREIPVAATTLVPDRWGVGALAAQAPVFACLTSELVVHADWARAMLSVLSPHNGTTVGASGAIALKSTAGSVAAAIYLARFSAFLPHPGMGSAPVENIPGDSAAYRREAVMAHPDLLSEGFWEAEFHRRFRAEGKTFHGFTAPLATFDTALRLKTAMSIRARHAHDFGITRVSRYRERRGRLLLAAPVVPLVLLARILRRATASPGGLAIAIRAFPALVLLCSAWAWGEATGAWATRPGR